MNVYLPNKRLPSTYQEVEYIWSSWTQYINTDIKLNQTHTIELKLNINSNLNQWDKFYWWWDDGSMLFAQYEKSSWTAIQNRIKITNKSSNNMYSTNPQTISAWWTHIFIHSNTSFYIDGVSQSTTTATTFTMNTWLNIFAMWNSQSTGREKSSYKLYYMKIYNSNSSLAYDFVPCYRKSDNVIWLYDLVNNQFYTNAWTGTFSKGNDVTMAVLKNAYIGEYVEETYTLTISSNNVQDKAKSWYRVKSVRMQGTVSFSGSAQAYIGTMQSTTWTWTPIYRVSIDKYTSPNSIWFYYWANRWTWYTYDKHNETVNSSNTLDATITRDWSSITWNWTTYSYTYTAEQKTNVLSVLDSATFSLNCSPYNESYVSWTITFTVVYEKI